jgi:hypothetical protein
MLVRYFLLTAAGSSVLALVPLEILGCVFSLAMPKWLITDKSRKQYSKRPLWWWTKALVLLLAGTVWTVSGAVGLGLLR